MNFLFAIIGIIIATAIFGTNAFVWGVVILIGWFFVGVKIFIYAGVAYVISYIWQAVFNESYFDDNDKNLDSRQKEYQVKIDELFSLEDELQDIYQSLIDNGINLDKPISMWADLTHKNVGKINYTDTDFNEVNNAIKKTKQQIKKLKLLDNQ